MKALVTGCAGVHRISSNRTTVVGWFRCDRGRLKVICLPRIIEYIYKNFSIRDLGIVTGRRCSKPLHEGEIVRRSVGTYTQKLAGRGQKICWVVWKREFERLRRS